MSAELKLRYHNSFIDVELGDSELSRPLRAQSLSPKHHKGCYMWAEQDQELREQQWRDQSYVRSLSEKLESLDSATLKMPSFDSTESTCPAQEVNVAKAVLNPGSAGHPELCRRPCLHFAAGYCGHGSTCNFCHEDHPQKAAKLDKKQREIMQNLHSKEAAALIVEYVKARVWQAGIEGGQILVDWLEAEGAGADVTSIQPRDLRHLRKTLSRLNLYSLLGIFTSKSSLYPQDERSKVECVFKLMHEIREDLISQKA